jgi:16S rRNA processing protein RimM
MTKEECYYLGKVTKPNGYLGGVNIYLDVDEPHEYEELGAVFIEDRNSLIPYFIKNINIHTSKNTAVVYFEDIEDFDAAQALVNKHLYLPMSSLPKLKGNQFYFHEIVGYQIIDQKEGNLGEIKEVLDYPNQALFQTFYKNKEVLIPINDDIIQKVDRKKKEILVQLPEGLLDVYLDEES